MIFDDDAVVIVKDVLRYTKFLEKYVHDHVLLLLYDIYRKR